MYFSANMINIHGTMEIGRMSLSLLFSQCTANCLRVSQGRRSALVIRTDAITAVINLFRPCRMRKKRIVQSIRYVSDTCRCLTTNGLILDHGGNFNSNIRSKCKNSCSSSVIGGIISRYMSSLSLINGIKAADMIQEERGNRLDMIGKNSSAQQRGIQMKLNDANEQRIPADIPDGRKHRFEDDSDIYGATNMMNSRMMSLVEVGYSETGHSSRGVRFFLRHRLAKFEVLQHELQERLLQRRLPVLQVVHAQFEEPWAMPLVAVGKIRMERRQQLRTSLKDLNARQVEQVLELLCEGQLYATVAETYGSTRAGVALQAPLMSAGVRHGGPRVFTVRRSVQGLWRPSPPAQLLALWWFFRRRPPPRLPKYSSASLVLALEALRGSGRWGSERFSSRGWDQLHLRNLFYQPLMRSNQNLPVEQPSQQRNEISDFYI